jgi:hypothetical protein
LFPGIILAWDAECLFDRRVRQRAGKNSLRYQGKMSSAVTMIADARPWRKHHFGNFTAILSPRNGRFVGDR